MATPKVILLKGDRIQYEAIAGGTITPGMAVEAPSTVTAQSGDAEIKQLLVADFADFVGGDIADNYSSGDTVKYFRPYPGAVFYGFLAAGENVTKGDPFVFAGSGAFRKAVLVGSAADDGGAVVAFAGETLNNTSGQTAARCKIEAK